MNVTDFRAQILAAIHEAKTKQPDAHLHLLYAPEMADPLELINESKRNVASIYPPMGTPKWPKEAWPRLITLDCRRVASYLLETDPSIDDPLLESSITQAHAEIHLGQHAQTILTNDDPGMAESAVCGWVVSPESALDVAARINLHSGLYHPKRKHEWVHWYQPAYIGTLWPALSAAQKLALLDDGVWLVHDVVGRLQRFSADPVPEASERARTRHFNIAQWDTADNVLVVTELTKKWHALCVAEGSTLPHDANQQLNRHVQAARSHGLDTEDLAVYVLAAVQLLEGATQSPEFMHLIHQVHERGSKLRDTMRHLPDSFWERYLPIASANAPPPRHTAQA